MVSARDRKIAKEAEVRQRWNQLERARAHLTMLQAIAAASPQRIVPQHHCAVPPCRLRLRCLFDCCAGSGGDAESVGSASTVRHNANINNNSFAPAQSFHYSGVEAVLHSGLSLRRLTQRCVNGRSGWAISRLPEPVVGTAQRRSATCNARSSDETVQVETKLYHRHKHLVHVRDQRRLGAGAE